MSLLLPPRPVRIGLFVLALLVIAWLSLSPIEELPVSVSLWDKAQHAIAYFGLALIGAWAFPDRSGRLAVGLVAFGVGVEILQAAMALGRQGDAIDAVANTLGVAVGLAVAWSARALLRARVR
ncbi:MAG: VanZ family protein [Caulobacter sp.]|jgi:VanZ family protein